MSVWRWSSTDTAINLRGDVARDSSGKVHYVSGREEIQQRLYILLSAKKGKFIYDRSIGSGIWQTDPDDGDAVLRIEAYARQALSGMPEAEVTGAEIQDGQITVFAAVGDEEYSIIVRREEEE